MDRVYKIKNTINEFRCGVEIGGHLLKVVPGIYRGTDLVVEDEKKYCAYNVVEESLEYYLDKDIIVGEYALYGENEPWKTSEHIFVYDTRRGILRNYNHMKLAHHCNYSLPTAISDSRVLAYLPEQNEWVEQTEIKPDWFYKIYEEGITCFSKPYFAPIEYPILIGKNYNQYPAFYKRGTQYIWNLIRVYISCIDIWGMEFEHFSLQEMPEKLTIKGILDFIEKQENCSYKELQRYNCMTEFLHILEINGFTSERLLDVLFKFVNINQRVFKHGTEFGFPSIHFNTLFKRCIDDFKKQNSKEKCLEVIQKSPEILFERFFYSDDEVANNHNHLKKTYCDIYNFVKLNVEPCLGRLCYNTKKKKYVVKGKCSFNNATLDNEGFLRSQIDILNPDEKEDMLFADIGYDTERGAYVICKEHIRSEFDPKLIYKGLEKEFHIKEDNVSFIDVYKKSKAFRVGNEKSEIVEINGKKEVREYRKAISTGYLGYVTRLPDNRIKYKRVHISSGKQENGMIVPEVPNDEEFDYLISCRIKDHYYVIQSESVKLAELKKILESFEISGRWCWEEVQKC